MVNKLTVQASHLTTKKILRYIDMYWTGIIYDYSIISYKDAHKIVFLRKSYNTLSHLV
jgi:hypothetical protein